jgi:prevent-host-death family protein
MISLESIHSLTDFKRNANNYVDQLCETRSLIVLTVNGKAAVVVQDASAFQDALNRVQAMEAEIRELKLAALRQDLQVGIEQLQNGQYNDYDEDTIDELFEDIRRDGRQELGFSG